MRTFRFRVRGFSTNPRDLRWYEFDLVVRADDATEADARAIREIEQMTFVPHELDLLED